MCRGLNDALFKHLHLRSVSFFRIVHRYRCFDQPSEATEPFETRCASKRYAACPGKSLSFREGSSWV